MAVVTPSVSLLCPPLCVPLTTPCVPPVSPFHTPLCPRVPLPKPVMCPCVPACPCRDPPCPCRVLCLTVSPRVPVVSPCPLADPPCVPVSPRVHVVSPRVPVVSPCPLPAPLCVAVSVSPLPTWAWPRAQATPLAQSPPHSSPTRPHPLRATSPITDWLRLRGSAAPRKPRPAMRQVPGGSRRARAASSSPGPVPGPVPGPGPFRGLLPRPPRQARPLLPLLALLAAATVLFLAWPSGERGTSGPDAPGPPSDQALRTLLSHLDPARLWGSFLRPLLHERVPGGPGSRAARQHILSHLRSLGAGWHLELDTFTAATPRGQVTFSNVVATVAPVAARRLVLACHYDTKVVVSGPFVGATDAAVPCALLLELATALDTHLRQQGGQDPAVTLQLLFLDGEEAFEEWSATDSLYGARHLAAKMAARSHPAGSEVTAMSLLVLLDLLGGPSPAIHSHFAQSHHWFLRLVNIEQRLRHLGLLHAAPPDPPFFRLSPAPGPVEDDHVPFLQRGVPVLHVIPTPFPWVWHTPGDTEDNLHPPTVQDLAKILVVFVAEFLQL